MTSKIIQDAFTVTCIIPQITFLFNLSITYGLVPVSWKRATVIRGGPTNSSGGGGQMGQGGLGSKSAGIFIY